MRKSIFPRFSGSAPQQNASLQSETVNSTEVQLAYLSIHLCHSAMFQADVIEEFPATKRTDENPPHAARDGFMVSHTTVRDICRPFIILFKITGTYAETVKDGRRTFSLTTIACLVYCVFILLTMSANAIRYMTLFQGSSFLSDQFMGVCIFSLCYTNAGLFMIAVFLSVTKVLPHILFDFESYQKAYGFKFDTRKMQSRVRWFVISSVVFIIMILPMSVVLMVFGKLDRNSLMFTNLHPFQNSDGIVFFIVIILHSIIIVLINSFYTTIFGMTIVLGFIVRNEYDFVSKQFKSLHLHINEGSFSTDFEKYRIQHENVTSLLFSANRLLKHVLFFIFAAALPVICLILYGVIRAGLPLEDIVTLLIFILNHTCMLVGMTYGAATINSKAHEPLDSLYRLEIEEIPDQVLHVAQIFISRLSGPPLGIDVYGMLVIEKSTFLMLFGTLVTYAIVVFQLPPVEDTVSLTTNCTCV